MLEKETLELIQVKAEPEDEKILVKVKVKNPVDRTLYAYGSVRQIFYDEANKKLTICLHDQHIDDNDLNKLHLPQPRIVHLEGKTTAEIKLKIAPTIKRIRPAAERGTGPVVEEINIADAEEIEVEIAHQDTPFYYNPKISNVRQFKEWGNKVAKAKFKFPPIKAKPAEKQKPPKRKPKKPEKE